MNHLISKALLIILFIIISFSSFKSYKLENKKRVLKSDIIELSDIKYGMFNVDEWKKQFAEIITAKIKEIKLTGNDREIARKKIEVFLYEVIENFEIDYKAKNNQESWFGVSAKNQVADLLGVFRRIKERIPTITEDILNFLEKEENRESIKNYILLQLDKYRDSTFQQVDYSTFKDILIKYNSDEVEYCKVIISNNLDEIDKKINLYNAVICFAYICILLNILLVKKHSVFKIILYILIAFHLLALGVFLPMIDIDARIGIMEFKLLGETISFKNQVLYYQSKSIVEVSKIMLTQDKIRVIIVGLLVIMFSVVFPVFKLVSSLVLLFNRQLKKNKIIYFLVFKSGKWSMADVMVVAIFMSYIGFSGIIESQLYQLEKISKDLNILTTNNSELQNGFYFFLGFVILSISISHIITNLYEQSNENTLQEL